MSGDDLVNSVEDLRELFSVLSEQVPGLLRGLRNLMYSKEAAENMADAVSTFYKKLVDAGIPRDEALDMARGYVLNLRELLGGKGGLNLNIRDLAKWGQKEDED
jgi:hypothetical protein